ncbi:conserved Plasmodium protein, unknown function [Plasmodium yoelii]|uniref:Uncharacterized protein n=3 Tax=Plasmodium yoelii TaxID=5861 RepID=A0AAE9WT67_PLAYO|nr:conserved Plasmodium protein, unknown function [Plasmodium yoelii]WBY58145.1 hypothetical protein Py17XNL_001002392 [Plasmodium yoelii yoelii]CDU85187.1 conserved Plasmodium protein, unknown function [Plasmodium yoelii]VTZ79082.1 conserved Plasmodium protein, unknown function [Plasmodium yoelii]|eukprot:XP_022813391.1 conserved Plasmodium protein, unknown function [Plasmodium yoelii]
MAIVNTTFGYLRQVIVSCNKPSVKNMLKKVDLCTQFVRKYNSVNSHFVNFKNNKLIIFDRKHFSNYKNNQINENEQNENNSDDENDKLILNDNSDSDDNDIAEQNDGSINYNCDTVHTNKPDHEEINTSKPMRIKRSKYDSDVVIICEDEMELTERMGSQTLSEEEIEQINSGIPNLELDRYSNNIVYNTKKK